MAVPASCRQNLLQQHLIPSTYYYGPGQQGHPNRPLTEYLWHRTTSYHQRSKSILQILLDFAASLQNPDKDKIFSYLFNQDDGIRSELLAEYIRRSAPSPDLYDLFLRLYTITDYSAGVYGADLLQKLASGRSDEQIDRMNSALADYPKNSPFTVGKRKEVRITGRLSAGLWISTQPSSLPAGMETRTTPGLSGQNP